MRAGLVAGIGAVCIGAIQTARADSVVAFDNFGWNGEYSQSGGNSIQSGSIDFDIGPGFVPTASGVITGLDMAIQLNNGDNVLDLWLFEGTDCPESLIFETRLIDEMPTDGTYGELTHWAGHGPYIEEGKTYWLAGSVTGNSAAMWYWSIDDTGPITHRTNGPPWLCKEQERHALRVTVEDTRPYIQIDGDCPGYMTVSVSGADPGQMLALIYGYAEGEAGPVPGCYGLYVDIARPLMAGVGEADEQGDYVLTGRVPAAGCGNVILQGVNLTICEKSKLVWLE
ncbi:MAG: hypothetical protein D8M59_00835 [Planctomycetes bacterium]|nr:hypothetical protein [Planctomycetota bacterium]NOG54734.1 hypothetical protein [Planctomycetota bacterium]